jgi:hypothetical protein
VRVFFSFSRKIVNGREAVMESWLNCDRERRPLLFNMERRRSRACVIATGYDMILFVQLQLQKICGSENSHNKEQKRQKIFQFRDGNYACA